jgi:hypothetical protein
MLQVCECDAIRREEVEMRRENRWIPVKRGGVETINEVRCRTSFGNPSLGGRGAVVDRAQRENQRNKEKIVGKERTM